MFEESEDEQQHAAQAEFAVGCVVPFGAGMHAAAVSARTHADGFNAERYGDVGVGRADADSCFELQVAIDGAQRFEDCSVGSELAGGAITDELDGESEWFRGFQLVAASTASSTARCNSTSRLTICA